MRHMSNIELFDEYTARILAQLYEAFPRKAHLDARALCGHDTIDEFGQVMNDAGRPSAHFEVALATIDWLQETGYVRVRQMFQYGADGAVLTAQGLLVLKASPESLNASEAIGDKISRNVKAGAIGAAKEAAKAAITAGVSLMMAKG